MHYWNRNNFEGLKSIGEHYLARQGYEEFGNYCLLREKGLRKQAIATLNKFITLLKKEGIKDQREKAVELVSLIYFNREVHQLMSQPLQDFLHDVFLSWSKEEKSDVIPHRWLGYISGDQSFYKTALSIKSDDEISLIQLASAYIKNIDYQTHHLSESIFLGLPSDARTSLNEANKLINAIKNEDVQNKLKDDLTYFERMLDSWEEYSNLSIKTPFPEWCESKGEKYNFWSIFYYDK